MSDNRTPGPDPARDARAAADPAGATDEHARPKPRLSPRRTRRAPLRDDATGRGSSARPLRILLVEDNHINRQIAVLMLGRLGYRADIAVTGLEAVSAVLSVREAPYDVVLMDIHMPEMDGLEAIRHIRAALAPGERPHIVAMTALATDKDREAIAAGGADAYLPKPIHAEQLRAVLVARERARR